MRENRKTLEQIQEECRRFADEVSDPEAARILARLADDLERFARESERPDRKMLN